MCSDNKLVQELIFRNKIKPFSNIELLFLSKEKEEENKELINNNSKTKYIIVFDFDTDNPEIVTRFEDLLVYGVYNYLIIIHNHYKYPLFENKNFENILSFLRERYIKVLDVDRIHSIQHIVTTEDYFSIICEK